ncbi:hypothetical protein A0H81_13671 [Grifola frondosa]|uniref:Uncharacterized protein n=1 Tax=Grifola frondosa TaxID=5627 RepID=A0A1C7LNL9_GRIFR|nr:hypothetical protein A0H81_13671 [Grifola frondosa]
MRPLHIRAPKLPPDVDSVEGDEEGDSENEDADGGRQGEKDAPLGGPFRKIQDEVYAIETSS